MNDVSISKKNILPTFPLFIVLVTGEMKDDHGNKVSRWVD